MREYRYFRAAGRSLDAINQWQDKARAARALGWDMAREVGAEKPAFTRAVCGFIFADDKAPDGWAKDGHAQGDDGSSRPFFVPNKRTKAGRELAARMKAAQRPSLMDFSRMLGGGEVIVGGNTLVWPGFEKIGDLWVILVGTGNDKSERNDFVPPEAEPMKASEYWALKEAQPAAA